MVLAARSEDDLEAVAAQIRGAGGEALAIPTDVADPDAAKRLVQRTLEAFGRLDAAFNNAGEGHMPTPLADLALADFDIALRVNARGIFLMMKHQIPAMLAADGGAIVNMSSTAGLSGAPGMAGYTAAKHAIVGLTETAALDYGAQGIRVNAIAPGPIFTHNLARADDAAGADRWPPAAAPPRPARRSRGHRCLAVFRPGVVHHRDNHPHRRRQARRNRGPLTAPTGCAGV